MGQRLLAHRPTLSNGNMCSLSEMTQLATVRAIKHTQLPQPVTATRLESAMVQPTDSLSLTFASSSAVLCRVLLLVADDLVTAVKFDDTGDYLAVGDKARPHLHLRGPHSPGHVRCRYVQLAASPRPAARLPRVQVLHRVPIA